MSGGLCPSCYAKYLILWLNIDRKHERAEAVPVAVAIDWPSPRTSCLAVPLGSARSAVLGLAGPDWAVLEGHGSCSHHP